MKRYRYAILGTGITHGAPGATGFGMANTHISSIKKCPNVELVAISELVESRAQLFMEKWNVKPRLYADYHQMLRDEKPDMLSICTWPHLHAEMTVAAAEAGVSVIHCEKPMATTWADAKRMKAAAEANGVKLSFNHQRRFQDTFQTVRKLLDEKVIGELTLIEAECGDFSDWGTHWLDMLFFYNDQQPVEWVFGQLESHSSRTTFGARQEDAGITWFRWANGVRGVMFVGDGGVLGAAHRITGTDGVIEVVHEGNVRIRAKGDTDWRQVPLIPYQDERRDFDLAIADVVHQLEDSNYVSMLNVKNAIMHTEVIFATYYSSLYRGQIKLPLTYEGNALYEMMDAKLIDPDRK